MLQIGDRKFDTTACHIMGILNVTPDSFSDGGKYTGIDQALFHAQQMTEEGAEVIDVGGESTRPGHTAITDEEEIARVAPVIEALKARFDTPVSVDTYKSAVAKAALQAGADLVNDIWGFKSDPEVARLTAQYGASCCLMHNRREAVYNHFLSDLVSDLEESVRIAMDAGVRKDGILLDPGVGFAKTREQNLEIIHHLDILNRAGFPVLLGTSRKSVIGLTLGLPVDQRLEGTLVTTVFAVLQGCAFVRVHDVKENRRAIRMAEAILHS